MSNHFVMYESAVKITRARHGGASIAPAENYNFSRNINATPLTVAEFQRAASEYPIVFVADGTHVMSVAVLGLRDGENTFLSPEGTWTAKFIPAFLRRYPFAFSQSGDLLELCIDESFPGLNVEGRGARIFADDGTPTAYVDRVLKFMQEYQVHFTRSQHFAAQLQGLGLLEPMRARVTLQSGQAISFGGFLTVNKDKLKALPAETLAALVQSDALELIYLHLNSLSQFEGLRERVQTMASGPTDAATAPLLSAEAP